MNPLSSQNIEFERRRAKMLGTNFSELKEFSVSNCGIVELPPLPQFDSLVSVLLSGNFLTSLPAQIVASCPNLHTLDLSNNLISSISEVFFTFFLSLFYFFLKTFFYFLSSSKINFMIAERDGSICQGVFESFVFTGEWT